MLAQKSKLRFRRVFAKNIREMSLCNNSRILEATTALRNIDAKWVVEIGKPDSSPEWIAGTDFENGKEGPFPALLNRIGERLRTTDRLTIAASFSLRFGWTSWVAIVPCILNGCVPDIDLRNISLHFGANTLHSATALHVPRGEALIEQGGKSALLRFLRKQLLEQTRPVVEALYNWSGFSKKGAWGQIISSWTSHFVTTYGRLGSQLDAAPVLHEFFEGDDEIGALHPLLTPVTIGDQTHLYQRRSTCCRYYLLPQGSLCASCPLVSDEERLARNIEFMKTQLERQTK